MPGCGRHVLRVRSGGHGGAEGAYRLGGVRCRVSNRDRYGRFLGTCYAADGENLNGWLVRNGHALAYRRYSLRYAGDEVRARNAGVGMHAGAFVKPWDWRRPKHRRLRPRCPR